MRIICIDLLKRIVIACVLILALGVNVSAGQFTINGINYYSDGTNLTVVKFNYEDPYKGDITIPDKILIGDIEYTVVAIDNDAFRGCTELTKINLPETCLSIGDFAFANCLGITVVEIPSSIVYIGRGCFGCCPNITEFKVSDDNKNFKAENDILYSFDGKRICSAAPKSEKLKTIGILSDKNVEYIDDFAFRETPLRGIDMPNLKYVGDCAFEMSRNMESYTMPRNMVMNMGSHIFRYSAIKSLTVEDGVAEIPEGMCEMCLNLNLVKLPKSLLKISEHSFSGCEQLRTLRLGPNLNSISSSNLNINMEEIVCENTEVPLLEGTVYDWYNNITLKVAQGSVDAYKAADGWNNLKIIGEGSLPDVKEIPDCPSGLYFATKGGRLMYKDEGGDIIDTNISSGDHAFQLGAAHNRIYVANAGKIFGYSANHENEGDGELFYINKIEDTFCKVSLVSNNNEIYKSVNNDGFKDFYSIYVDDNERKLYTADRSEGIRIVNVDKIGLKGTDVSLLPYLVKDSWLGYYGNTTAYGAINAGFVKDNKGVYWMGKKFNGYGIFRFKDSDIFIYPNFPDKQPYPVLAPSECLSTFYLDELNGYVYIYLFARNKYHEGLYRISLKDILNTSGASYDSMVLIDNSPVLLEGKDYEPTGITQISGDGENIYWSYIAPTSSSQGFIGTENFDPNNPFHKSGIKMVSAKGDKPYVKYAVENVEAYGVIPYKYKDVSGIEDNIMNQAAKRYALKGNTINLDSAANVKVYGVNGSVMLEKSLQQNSNLSLSGLKNGLYIIQILYKDGSTDIVKTVI